MAASSRRHPSSSTGLLKYLRVTPYFLFMATGAQSPMALKYLLILKYYQALKSDEVAKEPEGQRLTKRI